MIGDRFVAIKRYVFRCLLPVGWFVDLDLFANHDLLAVAPYWQIMSELFDGPPSSPTASSSATGETALVGKESSLHLLADLCNIFAFAAESGEELEEISRGSLAIQVCGAEPVRSRLKRPLE